MPNSEKIIYLQPKDKTMKYLKIQQLMKWVETVTHSDLYAAELLKECTEENIKKITCKELELMLNLIKAVYRSAYRTVYEEGKNVTIFVQDRRLV